MFFSGYGRRPGHDHENGPPIPINSIKDIIHVLFEPLKVSPTESLSFQDNTAALKLPSEVRFKKPLGKRILILDLETRPLKSTEQYFKGDYNWGNLDHISGGVFNHYVYAQIHGYDYKFIHASEFRDRHATWIKPSALANHIADYDFIVFLDSDATFRFLHLPIEWLLNYWNIEPHHSITMALDPWNPEEPQYNSDRFNRTYTNTGFMVVQNNNQTLPILKAWHECPDDTRYPTCSEWKRPKFHEQSAFGEFIRYDYEDAIKELPCGEANGFPGVQLDHCEGKFVRHYWFDKSLVKVDFRENVMNAFSLPIQRIFAENLDDVVVRQTRHVIL
jgi:hypothetical protein